MEQQLFHYNTKYPDYSTASSYSDGVAAVSFFYEISESNNPAMDPLLGSFSDYSVVSFKCYPNILSPNLYDSGLETLKSLSPPGGLELQDNYYYYSGSDTFIRDDRKYFGAAPNCSEPVLWIVYEKTIPISEAQMAVFRGLLLIMSGLKNCVPGSINPRCVHNFRPVHPMSTNVPPSSRQIAGLLSSA